MLSRDEAAASLDDIQRTQGRSAKAYGYESAAPFLILWGVIWFLGYSAPELVPQYAGWTWMALTILGFVLSAVIGMRRAPGREGSRQGLRFLAMWLVTAVYVSAVLTILKPQSDTQIGAFIPLLVAFLYALMGVWAGIRFVVAGAVIAALTMGGFFLLHDHFSLWMAFVGGGALIATGFWLRRA